MVSPMARSSRSRVLALLLLGAAISSFGVLAAPTPSPGPMSSSLFSTEPQSLQSRSPQPKLELEGSLSELQSRGLVPDDHVSSSLPSKAKFALHKDEIKKVTCLETLNMKFSFTHSKRLKGLTDEEIIVELEGDETRLNILKDGLVDLLEEISKKDANAHARYDLEINKLQGIAYVASMASTRLHPAPYEASSNQAVAKHLVQMLSTAIGQPSPFE
ncbi:hypothetical protein F5880DRAFT_1243168 [Lentinula raphanica]|nr:hypothetical protein F5880DRAFT_1243168 [Lentinula raphanica]